MQDKGYGYQTVTGYVMNEFPNMVPRRDPYQAAVGVIIPASPYLRPRQQAALGELLRCASQRAVVWGD